MDTEPLSKLDPAYTTVMRIEGALTVLPFLVAALVLGFAEVLPAPWTWAPLIVPVLIALVFVMLVPIKRYLARGYHMGADRLRVVKGVLFHADTVVPFSRVQHLDVEQGPLERAFGIARLILHTAGTHNASVTLPGLAHADAISIREAIRAHVKRESL
ncbi:PH domain-containing protein [Aurantiacibacter poecillastricola]|uniref:PH domain-containing protein n=1 Tax=Aurantiacibacter poecillastricola TaxID=3064385 RepID=UPI0027400D1B|nr:PH domain-containing protein [Aurantiacibacter sp. 219JJ12-13]MDP5260422.1 PH domain-containing protein [Aurantiacibacter sp. 219JJ12-13]